jgi:hypothetical protein
MASRISLLRLGRVTLSRAAAGNILVLRGRLATRSDVPELPKARKALEPRDHGALGHTHAGAWEQTWEMGDVARVFGVTEALRGKMTWGSLFNKLVIPDPFRLQRSASPNAARTPFRLQNLCTGLTICANERRGHGA